MKPLANIIIYQLIWFLCVLWENLCGLIILALIWVMLWPVVMYFAAICRRKLKTAADS